MRDKLIFKINLGIEEEIEQIGNAVKSLGALHSVCINFFFNQKMYNRHY